MSQTPNHEYSTPEQGAQNWHADLNGNFEALEVEIEIRDAGDPDANGYAPADGAKYLDTDTGTVYLGDGSSWSEAFAFDDGNWQAAGTLLEPVDAAIEGIDLTASSDGTVVTSRVEAPDGLTLNRSDSRGLELPAPATVTIGGSDATGGGTVVVGTQNTLEAGVVSGVITGGGILVDDGETTESLGNSVTAHWATVSGGIDNTAGGSDQTATRGATVGGGRSNTASGRESTVGGGNSNEASGERSTVAGGDGNVVSGNDATVGGGSGNDVAGAGSTIAGGTNNDAGASTSNAIGGGSGNEMPSAAFSTIGGGLNNLVSGTASAQVVSGGQANETSEDHATVSGGEENTASGSHTAVGGGDNNTASASHATVGGGQNNDAEAAYATVAGGGDSDTNSGNRAGGQYSVVGGGFDNAATSDYSTVGGGENTSATGTHAVATGGNGNLARGDSTTVGGGENNETVGAYSTIAGGQNNEAGGQAGLSYQFSAVGGGHDNWAQGKGATVPGGGENTAGGEYSFAGGYRASSGLSENGAFVWGDSSDFEVAADAENQFVVQAGGGVTIYSASDTSQNTGVELPADDGSWSSLSASTAKSNVSPVDPEAVLAGVESLAVSTWTYNENEGVEHMGPMAEQFHEQFGLGGDEKRISNVDADGVALAAIQGLAAKLEQKAQRIETLERDCERKDERIDDLEARLAALEAQADTDESAATADTVADD